MSTLYNLTTEYKKILDMALGMDEIDDETFEYIKSIDDAIEQKIESITYVIKELSNNNKSRDWQTRIKSTQILSKFKISQRIYNQHNGNLR